MTAFAPIDLPASDKPRMARKVALGLLFAVLLFRAIEFAAAGVSAVRYPWELDYGEGIVWQQARLIFTHQAYGPIDQFPAIVFHYTPLYHAVTELASGALGTDALATGRAISLLSTLVGALTAGCIARLLIASASSRRERSIVGWAAALIVLTFVPVAVWAPLMRVDMLALAFSLAGIAAAMKAIERPWMIFVASLAFVAAVFTKQIAVAAPAAAFAVLLFTRPRLAVQGIAACLGLGLATLLILGWLTDGGFYRHVFLYNVNRLDLQRLSWLGLAAAQHAIYVAVAGWVVLRRGADLRDRYKSLSSVRNAAASDVRLMIALAYVAVTTILLLTVAKSGSSINYFVEWCFAIAIFVAVGVRDLAISPARSLEDRGTLAAVLTLGIAVQAAITPAPPFDSDINGRRARQMNELSRQVAAAQKPVISDDMVLLLRSGRPVLWEPAIFAELASTGVWDERPFVQRIRNGEFAFFITAGKRGDARFDQRYNPAVADAIDEAYPVTDRLAGLTIHRPREKDAGQ